MYINFSASTLDDVVDLLNDADKICYSTDVVYAYYDSTNEEYNILLKVNINEDAVDILEELLNPTPESEPDPTPDEVDDNNE